MHYIDFWIISTFGCYDYKFCVYQLLHGHIFTSIGVEFLGQMITLYLILSGIARLLSNQPCIILIFLPAMYEDFNLSVSLPRHVLICLFCYSYPSGCEGSILWSWCAFYWWLMILSISLNFSILIEMQIKYDLCSWPLNCMGVRGTDPPCSGKSASDFWLPKNLTTKSLLAFPYWKPYW